MHGNNHEKWIPFVFQVVQRRNASFLRRSCKPCCKYLFVLRVLRSVL